MGRPARAAQMPWISYACAASASNFVAACACSAGREQSGIRRPIVALAHSQQQSAEHGCQYKSDEGKSDEAKLVEQFEIERVRITHLEGVVQPLAHEAELVRPCPMTRDLRRAVAA